MNWYLTKPLAIYQLNVGSSGVNVSHRKKLCKNETDNFFKEKSGINQILWFMIDLNLVSLNTSLKPVTIFM